MTRATSAALEQLEDLATAVSTSTGCFFFLFFSSSGFDVGKMADAASCRAAALLPVQTSELRSVAGLLVAWSLGRTAVAPARTPRLRRLVVAFVWSSWRCSGRQAVFGGPGVVERPPPLRSDSPAEDRWRANAVETIRFDCGGSEACPACSHVGDLSLIDSILFPGLENSPNLLFKSPPDID